LFFSVPQTFAKIYGSVNVDGYGKVYVAASSGDGSHISVHDNGVTLSGGGRFYFATKASGDFEPDMFWQVPLLGNHFSYEIDVSNVGCHCNAASYFVQMPGYGSNQQPDRGPGGDFYCDANFVNKIWCPEYDTFEGNKYTMQTTLHTCDYVPPKYYSHCDGGGCGTNAFYAKPGMYCPGCGTIDTNKPFTISHAQGKAGDGTMSYSNNWFSQEGRTDSFNSCSDGNYVKNMGYSLHGIVFAASLWGGPGIDMNWLDGMTGCGGQCNLGASKVTWRNFAMAPAGNSTGVASE